MAVDTTARRTRRAILTAGLGVTAATVANAVGRPSKANAQGTPIYIDQDNPASAQTEITSNSGYAALWCNGQAGMGLQATSDSATAVDAESGSHYGVFASSESFIGVFAVSYATDQPAVQAWGAGNFVGVQGYSSDSVPMPTAPAKTGVFGSANSDAAAVGVKGASPTGRGGVMSGKKAQLRLLPAAGNHPTAGLVGDFFVDSTGRLWYCKGGSNWKQLA